MDDVMSIDSFAYARLVLCCFEMSMAILTLTRNTILELFALAVIALGVFAHRRVFLFR